MAWLSVKLCALLLFFAWAIGIPGRWIEHRVQPLVYPYDVSIHRVTWNPLRGFIIHHIDLITTNIAANPVIRVDRAALQPGYMELLNGNWNIRSVKLENGTAYFPIKDTRTSTLDVISIHAINGVIATDANRHHIDVRAISDLGTHIHAQGEFIQSTSPAPGDPRDMATVHGLHLSIYQAPSWLNNIRERMQNLTMVDSPIAEISFFVDADQPGRNRMDGSFHVGRFSYLDRELSGIQIEASYTNNEVVITKAQIVDGPRRFALTGRYHRQQDIFSAHAFSDLSSDLLLVLAPESWQDHLNSLKLSLTGPMRSEAWIGPCPLAEVPRSWGGWLSAEQAVLHTFPVEKAFVSFKRDGAEFALNDGLVRGGENAGAGEISFSILTDYEKRISRGSFEIGADVSGIKEILPRGLQRVLDMFAITDKPMQFSGNYLTPLDHLDEIKVSGRLNATNIVFRGVPLTGADVGIAYAGNRVALAPFHARRPNGAVQGALDLDFTKKHYRIDLDITTNPKTIAPMAGKKVAHHFRHYAFSDDVFARIRGIVDTDNDTDTDLHVQLSGQKIDIAKLKFDRASFQAHRTPGRLAVSNITGQICNGTVTGALDIAFQSGNDTFSLTLGAHQVSVDRLAAMLGGSETNQYEGVIQAHAQLAGRFPDAPAWTNLSGSATLRVEDGRLLLIPVFGGLSSLLSAMVPGMGFSEQNLLTATVDFKHGALYSDNVKLQGNMLSIAASGRYHLMEGLNFYVQAHPFRDGSVASAVRVVTIPISFLLEFKVTGPLRNPRWRPANLPF